MDTGSRTSPIVLDDIGREFDSSDEELTDCPEQSGGYEHEPCSDDESNAYSAVEIHERSEDIHLDTRPSATAATLDGLNGATRWQVNRHFGERSVPCKCTLALPWQHGLTPERLEIHQ